MYAWPLRSGPGAMIVLPLLLLVVFTGAPGPLITVTGTNVCFGDTSTQTSSYILNAGAFNLNSNPVTSIDTSFISIGDVSLVIQSAVAPASIALVLTSITPPTTLWSTTFSQVVVGDPLNLVFQSDGNLVVYYKGSPIFGSNTCNVCSQAASTFLFTAAYPYIQFFNSSCAVVWTPTGAIQRPINAPSLPTSSMVPFGAHRSLPQSTFYRTLGVNTHFSQGYLNVTKNIELIKYMGFSVIRDGLASGALSSYVSVASAGIRINGIISGGVDPATAVSLAEQIYTSTHGMLASVEGPNELNNQPFTYNGVDPHISYAGMAQYQKDFYAAMKQSAVLNQMPVYHLTGGMFGPDSVAVGLNSITNAADYYNNHVYPSSSYPVASASIDWFADSLRGSYSGHYDESVPNVITEYGWSTEEIATFTNGVSLDLQARLLANSFFDAIYDGVSLAFVYELHNENFGNPNDPSIYYGMSDFSQTPKRSGTILHRLSTLLSSPQDISPILNKAGSYLAPLKRKGPTASRQAGMNTTPFGVQLLPDGPSDALGPSLNFSLTNLPVSAKTYLDGSGSSTVRFLTLKSDTGASGFWIPVWWNQIIMSGITPASVSPTFHLGDNKVGNITVYDVFQDAASDEGFVVAKCVACASISFPLRDAVVLINVEESGFEGPMLVSSSFSSFTSVHFLSLLSFLFVSFLL